MRSIFKKKGLQQILVTAFSLLILALLSIQGVVSYISMSQLISRKVSNASLVALEQMSQLLTERLNSIMKIGLSIVINDDIQRILVSGSNQDYYEQLRSNEQCTAFLSNIANTREDISEIVIFTNRMDIYNYSPSNGLQELDRVSGKTWATHMQEQNRGFVPTRENDIRMDTSSKSIITYFHRFPIYSGEELGILCINIKESSIREMLHTYLPKGNLLFILNEEGYVISPYLGDGKAKHDILDKVYKDQDLLLGSQGYKMVNFEGNQYLAIYTRPNQFGWRVVQFKPYSEITEGINKVTKLIFVIGIGCAIIALLFIFYFSRSIFTPIKELVHQMNTVTQSGNLEVVIDDEYTNEIGELNKNFEAMMMRIKDLLEEVEKENCLKMEAELKALQSQINPHFLYNTLDSINWMAIKLGSSEISKMASNLGNLFRISLNKGRDMISIKGEIEHIRCYINIQSIRYNEKFKYIEDLEPEIFQYHTIKLILQPLVENSLIHGFDETKGEGEIHVKGICDGPDILFTIWDDGSGVDAQLMNESLDSKEDFSFGYGVKNVDQRIKINFGPEYGLTYCTVDKGTQVKIRIPKILVEENVGNA